MNGQRMHSSIRLGATALLAIIAAAASTSVGHADAYDVAQQPMIGDAAPTFALETSAGDTLALEELQGKYLVIHFGASW